MRSIRYLERVALLNYKEIFNNDDSSEDERNQSAIIKMQLDWRQESKYGNFGPVSMEVKSKLYLIERRQLESFISQLKVELRRWKCPDIACSLL